MQRPESETDNHKDSITEDEPKVAEDYLGAKILIRSQEDELLMSITDSLREQVNNEINPEKEPNVKCKKRKTLRIFLGAACLLITTILVLVVTPFGQGILYEAVSGYAYSKMNHNDGSLLAEENIETVVPEASVTPSLTLTPEPTKAEVKQVTYNILLLGEEALESGTAKGRTDIMMIATLDTEDKCIKLTSLMRDMLVDIPGYKENKLNTTYEHGGVPLLYNTIYDNFGIKLDGYMLVGFDAFEAIINKLGGVNINLTETEAEYLNKTNYISKEKYRNVRAGAQLLNGNQALGYCRIRYVATGDQELNDFGRTSRQRVVLNAIFDNYKTKSFPELALIANSLLSYITTDLTQDEFTDYLKLLATVKDGELKTLRIPADNTYEVGSVRGMSVLIPDKYENRKLLRDFLKQDRGVN